MKLVRVIAACMALASCPVVVRAQAPARQERFRHDAAQDKELRPCLPDCPTGARFLSFDPKHPPPPGAKYDGFYEQTKAKFFATRESVHESVNLDGPDLALICEVRGLHSDLLKRVQDLLAKHVDLINVLDQSTDLLARAAALLRKASASDLATRDEDRARNARTLADLKRSCNLPSPL